MLIRAAGLALCLVDNGVIPADENTAWRPTASVRGVDAGVKGGGIATRQRFLRADRLRGGVSRSATVAIALGTSR